ncbi:MAG: biotin/lipoyl-binding protein [Eubacterium sp.]|nr:biotin/lipoyl-binding protein [Eubacterium sp.]
MKNYTITVNGTPYNVTVEEGASSQAVSAPVTQAAPAAPVAAPAPAAVPAPAAAAGSVKVEAPMPGTILDVKVSVGAAVTSGQVLCILEAMKMENDIVAPQNGTVASININKGDSVEAGQVIITLS